MVLPRSGPDAASIPAASTNFPPDSRQLRGGSSHLEGNSNDGYADNLSFILTVPEPSTILLLGMGLGGLGLAGDRYGGSRRR